MAEERFELPNQGAHDISRHDVVKDVARVERFVEDRVAHSGWAVALSNDSSYWRPGTKSVPVDAMFRVHEGRQLKGTLEWVRFQARAPRKDVTSPSCWQASIRAGGATTRP